MQLHRATDSIAENTKKVEQYQKSFTGLETAEQKALIREKETKAYLDMQVDHNRELEGSNCVIYVEIGDDI